MTAAKEKTEFLTGPQVQARYQKSHVTLWRWVRDPDMSFPRPIKINRLNFWRLAELESWENAQAEKGAA
jgi:predicted DNA-binding transcriptional regulator AlpA